MSWCHALIAGACCITRGIWTWRWWIKSFKRQDPSSREISNFKHQFARAEWCFFYWIFSGAWNLGIWSFRRLAPSRQLDIMLSVLERRRIASVPLRRDGGGKSELHRARCRVTSIPSKIHAGGDAERHPDGKCHREYTAGVRKNFGKGEKVE